MSLTGMQLAWQEAGRDLGVTVVTPYSFTSGASGRTVECAAWVAHFGAVQGALLLEADADREPMWSEAKRQGQHCSILHKNSYDKYDRENFIATLNDWGWFGEPASAPDWYTGQPWSD